MAATDGFWGKFRHWRRRRPFWGSLIMLIAGLELLYTANADLGDLKVHIGPQGFLSYVVPLVIILCALLAAFTPAQRLFYGIVGLLASLYSFIGLNLGGFFLGMLLGILGGALVIAWGPPKRRPGTPLAGPPTDEPTDHHEDGPVDVGDDIFNERRDIDETQQIEIAGHDDRPHEPAGPGGPASPPGPAAPAGSPGPRGAAGSPGPAGSPGSAGSPVRPASQGAAPEEPPTAGAPRAAGLQRLARNPRAMVLALVPVAVTATIIAAGSTLPASADDECPAGLPSIATTTTSPAAADPAKKSAAAAKTTEAAAEKTTAAAGKTTAAADPTTTATATQESSTPILDGIEGVVDGVSNLLGIGDETPSTSPSPSVTTTTPAADPTTTAPAADPTTGSTTTATSAEPTKTTKAAAATTAASDDVIPCLGPRVFGKLASADDIPTVAKKPGAMEVDSLTMYNSTYDGVVDMPTAGGGSYKALKFSMDKAVNKPFKLTVDEPNGAQTVISSKELTTTGTVKFYTPEFKGNLFGLIPVTFTPSQPPPLTLPVLWFTDVHIQLAFVRSDVLTGDPLHVQEIS
ncbi:DUF6114 domain-containing protein [Paractinoplanes globisporus]|uniref:DUF6114 domain-containing protein n=1 Tax=Paractinoplanes globisporus TaxID=113565 RepID=A0ABW6WAY5_9ACTN|nr:DUF6114 domain-containing protein [Actinoplanes globisporus]